MGPYNVVPSTGNAGDRTSSPSASFRSIISLWTPMLSDRDIFFSVVDTCEIAWSNQWLGLKAQNVDGENAICQMLAIEVYAFV